MYVLPNETRVIDWLDIFGPCIASQILLLIKDSFKEFKVKAKKIDPLKRILFDENYASRFSLYWQIPSKFKSREEHQVTTSNKENIQYLKDLRISY